MAKSTRALTEIRVTKILGEIACGVSKDEIFRRFHEESGLTKQSFEKTYWAKACKRLREAALEQAQIITDQTMIQLNKIIQQNQDDDPRVALEAMRERAKITGIYAPEKRQSEIKIVQIDEFEDL